MRESVRLDEYGRALDPRDTVTRIEECLDAGSTSMYAPPAYQCCCLQLVLIIETLISGQRINWNNGRPCGDVRGHDESFRS